MTRDLRDIADIEKLTELPQFVRFLAEHSGHLVNYSQFGGSIDVSHKTAQRYVALLEQVFLVSTLQPWYTNRLKRIVKTPKPHFLDSGLRTQAETCKAKFIYGVVLYDSADLVPFGDKLATVPLSSLWG